jgi:predicted component of type VI protein secretion system
MDTAVVLLETTLGAISQAVRALRSDMEETADESPVPLALDWNGSQEELLVGRHPACDVQLSRPGVSRYHARLTFRDGVWVLRDLDSTNGTTINGARVGRCRVRPGDHLVLGDEHVRID